MIPPASPELIAEMGGVGRRFARAFQQLRDARATWQIFRLLVIVQAIPVIWDLVFPPGHSAPEKLSQAQILLGLAKPNFLSGDLWQPLTYALIHGNWAHLLGNGAAILLLGSKVEHIAGKKIIPLVAIPAAVLGGVIFIMLSRHLGPEPQRLVGSSAVCFAFLLLLTTLSPESRFLPFFISGRALGIGVILVNLLLTLLNPDLPTGPLARLGAQISEGVFPGLFRISHACHLGGSLVGFFAGKLLLRPRVTIDSLRKDREKREGKGSAEK